ncbi:MAG: bifunctional DNA primase/polymerase [Bdellovibrionaceae bacterium]|nr:bifunctional DNA primase/polymerase [Pseudobdellovibrionaceae bacterium]
MKNTKSKLQIASEYYAEKGFSIFPLIPRSKKPLFSNWQRDATADKQKVFDIWIVTGTKVVALDIDSKNGFDRLNVLSLFEEEFGKIPSTVAQITGGSGLQYFFKPPNGVQLKNRVAMRQNIDFRAVGGFVVAPPSIHPNGKEYFFDYGQAPWETELAQTPEWLVKLVTENQNSYTKKPQNYWSQMLRTGIVSGERNHRIAQISGLLIRHFDLSLTCEIISGINKSYCHPPLSDEEILRTVHSIASIENRKRVHNESKK